MPTFATFQRLKDKGLAALQEEYVTVSLCLIEAVTGALEEYVTCALAD